ncbi:MAG: FAA hydrolase family protein [Deltaproteobacteria bacterium]|nr:MAG: FAA hydrolase family protein [Deltaproteobacteria bacterium]
MKTVSWGERTFAPSKLVCVGRNYVKHIEELNNPVPGELVLFLKPNSSLSDSLVVPQERCRFETEITFLMEGGRPVAVGLGLDLTLVEVQQRLKESRLPWEKAKAFDGAAVMSPFVDLPQDWSSLWLELFINGESRQKGGVPEMIHKPEAILAEVARHFSLADGDLVMTGTPHGVGDLVAGDVFEVSLWDGENHLLQHSWIETS